MKSNEQMYKPILQNKELTRYEKLIKVIKTWSNSAEF